MVTGQFKHRKHFDERCLDCVLTNILSCLEIPINVYGIQLMFVHLEPIRYGIKTVDDMIEKVLSFKDFSSSEFHELVEKLSIEEELHHLNMTNKNHRYRDGKKWDDPKVIHN